MLVALLAVLGLTAATALVVWREQVGPGGPPAHARGESLIVDREDLLALPTEGAAWEALLETADGDLGTPDLRDQDNTNAARTLAAALVHARTGDTGYRDRVIEQLEEVPGTADGARVLAAARQIAGYAVAASLVDYRDPAFVEFLSDIRTRKLGGHGRWYAISQTSEDTASNWGAWSLASRIAVAAYLGDDADLRRAATVLRGFLGDREAYAGFLPTSEFDASWVCGDVETWVPVNPGGCGGRSGAIVEDVSRSAGSYPAVDGTGVMYMWEVLGGASLSARLLSRQGYPDVWAWSDDALLRAAVFVRDSGGYPPPYDVNQYIPWEINKAYDAELGPIDAAGFGRQFGFTDWLP